MTYNSRANVIVACIHFQVLKELLCLKTKDMFVPLVLVDADRVEAHLHDPLVRLVDVDTTAYDQGHIPGAVGFNWRKRTPGSGSACTYQQGTS